MARKTQGQTELHLEKQKRQMQTGQNLLST